MLNYQRVLQIPIFQETHSDPQIALHLRLSARGQKHTQGSAFCDGVSTQHTLKPRSAVDASWHILTIKQPQRQPGTCWHMLTTGWIKVEKKGKCFFWVSRPCCGRWMVSSPQHESLQVMFFMVIVIVKNQGAVQLSSTCTLFHNLFTARTCRLPAAHVQIKRTSAPVHCCLGRKIAIL